MSQALKEHYDFLFKVILVGEGEATKTGLLWALTGSHDIISDYKNTIGVNFGIASVFLERPNKHIESNIKLQIWDISCEPRAKYLRHLYYKGASGVIMVVKSLTEAQHLMTEINSYNHHNVPVLFILTENSQKDFSQYEGFSTQLRALNVKTGSEGIEWLAETMLNCHKHKRSPSAAIFVITEDLVKATIQNLHQVQLLKEQERLRLRRERRAIQIRLIKEVLSEMEIPVEDDIVQVLSSDIFFKINLIDGVVELYPLKCEECATSCVKINRNQICIVSASDGYAEDLDKNSLLIISKIYAIMEGKLPSHVENQIKRIKKCVNYSPKKASQPIHA